MPTLLIRFNPLKFLLQGFLVLVLFFLFGVSAASAAVPAGTMTMTTQTISTATGGAALNTITVTSSTTEITAVNDIFIRIPAAINARFDTTDITVTIVQSSTGVTSTTVSYPVNNKTVKLDVTTNFASGENVQVGGLTILGDAATASTALLWAVDNTTEASAIFSTTSGSALIINATDAAATLTLANAAVGTTQNTTLTFTLSVILAASDTVTFTAPANLDVSGLAAAVTGTLESTDSVTCAASGQVVTCTTSAASAAAGAGLTIIMTGVTGKLVGTTDITDLAVNDFSATPSLADINSDTTVAMTDTTVGTLTSTSMTPASTANSSLASYVVAFTTVGTSMDTGAKIVIVFPTGYDISGTSGNASGLSGLNGTWAVTFSGQTMTLTQGGGTATAVGVKSLTVANVRNPSATGSTGTFTLTTTTSGNANIQTATPAAVSISAGSTTSTTLGDIEGIEVTDNEDGGVLITWTDPSDDTSYVQILKGTDPYPVSGTAIATVAVGDESYVDEDVEIGETVTYMLRGSDSSDTGDLSAEYEFVVGSSLTEEEEESTEEESTEEEDTEEESSEEESSEESEEESSEEESGEDESEEDEEEAVEITDVADHWAVDEIETMVDYGIVEGNPDGTFLPDGNLNRAEAAALLWRVLGLGDPEDQSQDPFDDVDMDEWYAAYIGELSDLNLISGNPDGTYEPGENINRAEFLKLAMNVYLYLNPEMESEYNVLADGEATNYYADLDTAEWYAGVVTAATDWKFISGSDCDDDKCFNAASSITRAEATKILYSMFLNMLAYEGVSLELDLDSQTDDGIMGTATLTQSGGRTWVEVMLDVYGESDHPAHIHGGDCEDTGDIAWSLEDVEAGYSITELEVSLATILDALPLYINVHMSEDDMDTAVACGNI